MAVLCYRISNICSRLTFVSLEEHRRPEDAWSHFGFAKEGKICIGPFGVGELRTFAAKPPRVAPEGRRRRAEGCEVKVQKPQPQFFARRIRCGILHVAEVIVCRPDRGSDPIRLLGCDAAPFRNVEPPLSGQELIVVAPAVVDQVMVSDRKSDDASLLAINKARSARVPDVTSPEPSQMINSVIDATWVACPSKHVGLGAVVDAETREERLEYQIIPLSPPASFVS